MISYLKIYVVLEDFTSTSLKSFPNTQTVHSRSKLVKEIVRTRRPKSLRLFSHYSRDLVISVLVRTMFDPRVYRRIYFAIVFPSSEVNTTILLLSCMRETHYGSLRDLCYKRQGVWRCYSKKWIENVKLNVSSMWVHFETERLWKFTSDDLRRGLPSSARVWPLIAVSTCARVYIESSFHIHKSSDVVSRCGDKFAKRTIVAVFRNIKIVGEYTRHASTNHVVRQFLNFTSILLDRLSRVRETIKRTNETTENANGKSSSSESLLFKFA